MLVSMKLTTTKSIFHMPRNGETLRQSVTVRRDGCWWLSEYEMTKEGDIRCFSAKRYRVSSEKAAEILDAVEGAVFDDGVYIMDGGEFDLVKVFEGGRKEKIHGNVSPLGVPLNGDISSLIRRDLSNDGLFGFDC